MARLNMSHGDHKSHKAVVDLVREYNRLDRGNVAIMLDTKGPEVRSGDLAEPIDMKPGARPHGFPSAVLMHTCFLYRATLCTCIACKAAQPMLTLLQYCNPYWKLLFELRRPCVGMEDKEGDLHQHQDRSRVKGGQLCLLRRR